MDLQVKLIENDTKEDRMLNTLYSSPFRKKFVEVGDEKFVLPIFFNDGWDVINKLEVRDDDVFITGHPRSGTTWLNEIVNLMILDRDEDRLSLGSHIFIDGFVLHDKMMFDQCWPNMFKDLHSNLEKSPRTIKTHLPWYLLPEQIRNGTKTPKIIHIVRNPKDTCISFYYIQKNADGYTGTFEEFCKLFLAGKLYCGPYFHMVRSYWDKRNTNNVLIITYSDLKMDTFGTVNKIAQFLEKPLSDEKIEMVMKKASVESMRNTIGKKIDDFFDLLSNKFHTRSEKSDFIRFANQGNHKSAMSAELIQAFDRVIKKEVEETGIPFE